MMHLQSASMLAILPLQDYLSLKPELCFDDPDKERINVPAISPFYWRFRMKTTTPTPFNSGLPRHFPSSISHCGRGEGRAVLFLSFYHTGGCAGEGGGWIGGGAVM